MRGLASYVRHFLAVFILIGSVASAAASQPEPVEGLDGLAGELFTYGPVHSPQLGNERTVRVWLPPDYDTDPSRRFPVIYFHDGQNAFDPETSNWGVEWELDETLTRMQKERGHSAIVVAVEALIDPRTEEYTYSRKGEAYASFLIDTVKPMIDRDFRTNPDREATSTMGASMGALISVALVWRHSDVFSSAAALSLPAHHGKDAIFHTIRGAEKPSEPIRIYMDHGTRGFDSKYRPHVERFYLELLRQGMTRKDLKYLVYKDADHTEEAWANRVHIPLRWIFEPDYQ